MRMSNAGAFGPSLVPHEIATHSLASTTLTVGETEVEQRGKHSAALKPYKPDMVRFGVVVWSIKCFVKT